MVGLRSTQVRPHVKGIIFVVPAGVLGAAALLLLGLSSEPRSTPTRATVPSALHVPVVLPVAPRSSTAVPAARVAPSTAPAPVVSRGEGTLSLAAALMKAAADPERNGFDDALLALRGALEHASAEQVAQLLELFKTSTDATLLNALAEALEPHGLARPEVRAALSAIADSDPLLDRRAAAIAGLGFAKPDDVLLGQLDRLARNDREADIRTAAANALGAAAERDPSRGPAIAKLLLAVAATDADEGVRSAALWSVHGRDADADAVAQLARVLVSDRDMGPRQAAADALAEVGPEHRAAALSALSGSLVREHDEEVRQSVLTSIVRAGRADAIPVLEAVKANHADLAQDAEDYLVELRKGETDIEVLHALKQQKDDARIRAAEGDEE